MTLDDGLPLLNREEIFAPFWTRRDDQMEEYRLKGVKCAEVLVPISIDVNLITGAYVANDTALRLFQQVSSLTIEIRADIFF